MNAAGSGKAIAGGPVVAGLGGERTRSPPKADRSRRIFPLPN